MEKKRSAHSLVTRMCTNGGAGYGLFEVSGYIFLSSARSISPRSVQLRFTAGDFWDPEEPNKIYFLTWIHEIISMTCGSVEESAAKTMKST